MLDEMFKTIELNYRARVTKKFKHDNFTRIITKDIPEIIASAIGDDSYLYKGSVGQGNWAETPWVAVLDKRITNSTQEGYYVCFLINPVKKLLYLSLAVGWTQFGSKFPQKVAEKRILEYSKYLHHQLNNVPDDLKAGTIDLSAVHLLSKGYEKGQILNKKYVINEITTTKLISDLKKMLKVYDDLITLVGSDIENIDYKDVVVNKDITQLDKKINSITLEQTAAEAKLALNDLINDVLPAKKVVILKKAARNPKIAKLIKISQNYICELCGRKPFIQKNGFPYAEADHVKPLGKQGTDSADNIRCLCAQCHRIITFGAEEEVNKILK